MTYLKQMNTVPKKVFRRRKLSYDYSSLEWLSNSYIMKHGLRGWTWKAIIEGIIREHQRVIEANRKCSKCCDAIGSQHVKIIWYTFFQMYGITNLQSVPKLESPESPDVKAIVFVYSMESFLFIRIN